MGLGLFAGLIKTGVTLGKEFIHNAKVGKQVLAAGGSVTTTSTGAGTTSTVSGGGALQLPVWAYYIVGGFGLLLVLFMLFKKKR